MTSIRTWGALVAAALPLAPVACSSAPAPVTTAPAPSAPPAVSAAVAPPPHLTGFADLFTTTPPRTEPTGDITIVGVRFGRGLFIHQTYSIRGRPQRVCPLARAEGCATFAFQPDPSPAPTADIWPPAGVDTPVTLANDYLKPGPFAAPHAWQTFAGGRDAVYALREGGKHIDRIDDQGKVTPFVSDDAMKDWTEIWVIELHGRTFVAGMDASWRTAWYPGEDFTMPSWKLHEVMSGGSGQSRRLGPPTTLPMQVMPSRYNAQGARMASRAGAMAALRLPEVVALPDEGSEKDRWAMVWLEVIPPTFSWRAGRPQKGVSTTAVATPANRPPRKGSRHSCGGPASRSLDDPSVTKRAHVTRFAGAKLLDDQVRWTGARVGAVEAIRLAPRLDEGHLVVALPETGARAAEEAYGPLSGPTWEGNNGRITLAHTEEITALVYEPTAHEGLVAIRDGDHHYARRFDATGKPIGDAIINGSKDQQVEQAALVDGKWMAISSTNKALYNLTDGGDELTRLHVPRGNWLRIVSIGGHGVLLHITRDGLFSTPLDASGVSSDPVKVDELPEGAQPDSFHVFAIGDTKAVSMLVLRGKGDHDRMAWRRLAPGATWQYVDLASKDRLHPTRIITRDVHGDLVIRFLDQKEHFTWLRAGASITRPQPESNDDPFDLIHVGPLLGQGMRLPNEPGQPVRDDALVGLGQTCQRSVMTGPDTVVMGCVYAPDPAVPQLRAALRTLHIDSAR